MLISLRQGPSSPAQRLRKATPGTYSKNSQKHSSSIVLDQQRRSAKTQNPTSLHRLLCWCTLIKQGIRAEGTGKSFTEAVTRTLAPTLLLRQTINLPLRRQPPCRVALPDLSPFFFNLILYTSRAPPPFASSVPDLSLVLLLLLRFNGDGAFERRWRQSLQCRASSHGPRKKAHSGAGEIALRGS